MPNMLKVNVPTPSLSSSKTTVAPNSPTDNFISRTEVNTSSSYDSSYLPSTRVPSGEKKNAQWVEVVDDNTGRTFFYNTTTGVSKWILPKSEWVKTLDIIKSPVKSVSNPAVNCFSDKFYDDKNDFSFSRNRRTRWISNRNLILKPHLHLPQMN